MSYVLRCKNHPTYRWWCNTFNSMNPGGKLHFAGEVPTEAHPTGRPNFEGPPAYKVLKARMEGKNPYVPWLEDEKAKEDAEKMGLQDVRDFISWVDHVEQKFVFECECPASALEKVEDEDVDEMLSSIQYQTEDVKR